MPRADRLSFILFLSLLLSLHFTAIALSQEKLLLVGEVNSDSINIRSDSTVSSEIICSVNKGERLEVVSELYEWYRVRLPKNAPSFIKKNLVNIIEDKNITQPRAAEVLKDKVNIRLHPSESSTILGRVNKNEIINILQDKGEWFKIEPVNNSFGWINKKFVSRAADTTLSKIKKTKYVQKAEDENKTITPVVVTPGEDIIIEGTISPYGMVLRRPATHKLTTEDKQIFLLTGNKKGLDALNYHKVKVKGKVINLPKQKYPIIEVAVLETIN